MPLTSNERDLVKQALAGDQAAFEMIIRTYSRQVFARAYSILRQPEEAEDVVQETFLKAWNSKWKIRDPEKFPQWLFSIARNQSLDFVRKRRTVPLTEDAEEIENPSEENPDRQMEGTELRAKIGVALEALPENHRLAVTLRYLEGMDHQGIEQVMGLSNGALRGILGRAMQTLRVTLKPVCP